MTKPTELSVFQTQVGVYFLVHSTMSCRRGAELSLRGPWSLGNLNLVDYFPPGSQASYLLSSVLLQSTVAQAKSNRDGAFYVGNTQVGVYFLVHFYDVMQKGRRTKEAFLQERIRMLTLGAPHLPQLQSS